MRMKVPAWFARLSPDLVATLRRFPLALLFTAVGAALTIAAINETQWLRNEVYGRLVIGLWIGTVLALAGVYFMESRPRDRLPGILLAYVLPFGAIALLQVTDETLIVPFALPVVAVLWLSVSPFTRLERGQAREEQQDRFWWINHQAIATAIIAAAAFLIICIGIAAIERSLDLLFGLSTGDVFYRWVLPFTGLFLTPVYWFTTLPRLDAYRPGELAAPDITARAVAFLGEYVLVPLLLIYALILLAYTAQIVLAQRLPQGMIGWMVLGFVIIGAATWLVLHPPFMRNRPLVRFFHRWWFWLTLVPLALFFFAVWERVAAYGLTPERVLLVAAGLWAVLLAALFLLRRGDIRAIPALAGALLLLFSVGPWNYESLPTLQQSARLDALLNAPSQPSTPAGTFPDWTPEQAAEARGAIDFMTQGERRRDLLVGLLQRHGVEYQPGIDSSYQLMSRLGHATAEPGGETTTTPAYQTIRRDYAGQWVDVAATPVWRHPLALWDTSSVTQGQIVYQVVDNRLLVGPGGLEPPAVAVDLGAWLARQTGTALVDPWVDFTYRGTGFRFAIDAIDLQRDDPAAPPRLARLEGQLFSAAAPPSP